MQPSKTRFKITAIHTDNPGYYRIRLTFYDYINKSYDTFEVDNKLKFSHEAFTTEVRKHLKNEELDFDFSHAMEVFLNG